MDLLKFFSFAILSMYLLGCSSGANQPCNPDSCGVCEANQYDIKICEIQASPASPEYVMLINYSQVTVNLSGYKLWDKAAVQSNSGSYSLSGTIGPNGLTTTFSSLPFTIDAAGEIIYLKDSFNNTVDQISN